MPTYGAVSGPQRRGKSLPLDSVTRPLNTPRSKSLLLATLLLIIGTLRGAWANPDGAGTVCSARQMADMAASTHGAAQTGTGGYNVTAVEIEGMPGFWNFTITGDPFKGLLMWVGRVERSLDKGLTFARLLGTPRTEQTISARFGTTQRVCRLNLIARRRTSRFWSTILRT